MPKRYKTLMLSCNYWKIWWASTASNVGDGVVLVAIPLIAAQLTREPLAVAATTIAVRLPWLVFGLFAGVIVDRSDRRKVMILTDVGRAAGFTVVALLVAAGQISLPVLYISVFAMGVLETLFDGAAMSIVPSVVPAAQLEQANGRLFAAQIAANSFAGPALGGLLFAAVVWLPFGFNSVTFLASALLLIGVRGSFRPKKTSSASISSNIGAGMAIVWREPIIRTFAIGAGVLNLGFIAAIAVLVLHAQDNLGLSDVGYGLLLASAAVGGVAGAQTASRVVAHIGRYRSVVLAVVVIGAGLAVIGGTSSVWIAGASFAIVAFAEELWNVVSVTYRQLRTPDEMLGRVMSSFRVIAYETIPLGALLGGIVADLLGVRAAFVVGGLIVFGLLPVVLTAMTEEKLSPQ